MIIKVRTNFGKAIVWAVLAVMSFFMCLELREKISYVGVEPTEMSDTHFYDIDEGEVYRCDQVEFLDYITETNGNQGKLYMLVYLQDENEEACLAAMEMQKGDAIYERVIDYLKDDSQEVGSLSAPVYFATKEFDSKVLSSFNSSVYRYEDDIIEKIAVNEAANQDVYTITEMLDYMGDGSLSYKEFMASSKKREYAGFAFWILLTAFCAVISIRYFAKFGGFSRIKRGVNSAFESDIVQEDVKKNNQY